MSAHSQVPGAVEGYPGVSLVPAGFLTLPEHYFCADQLDKTVRNTVPSMSFLIRHPAGCKIVFDLGMRKRLENYPEDIQPHLKTRQPITTEPDAVDSLRKGGLEPSDVDAVVLSHVHYDHVGTPKEFTKAYFVLGRGSSYLLEHGMRYHSAAKFERDLLPKDRAIELPEQAILPRYRNPVSSLELGTIGLDRVVAGVDHAWKPLGPFSNTTDLFGDGMVYIVDSPGHLPGHLNLLVRISPEEWIYLAGDACHHSRILNGQSEMASWHENGMHVCIHVDKDLATDTLRRIQNLRSQGLDGASVEVVLAHDARWFNAHQDAVWPSVYSSGKSKSGRAVKN